MNDDEIGLSDSEVASKIEAALFPEKKKAPAVTPPAAPEQAAPAKEPTGDDGEEPEPEEDETEDSDDGESETDGDNAPDIEPPSSMPEELRAAFAQLTPEMKKFLIDREADVSKGGAKLTGKLAEDRKALETAQAELASHTAQLNELAKQYRHPDIIAFETKYADILSGKKDLAELAADPIGLQDYQVMERKAITAHHREAANREKAQADFKADIAKKQAATHEKLAEKIPNWFGDTVKAEKSYKAIGEYLVKEYGMDPQRVSLLHEFGQIDIVRKAMLYDRAQKAKAEREKAPAVPPPKVMRPGTKVSNAKDERRDALRSRLKKSGRIDDAARLIETML